MNRRRVTVSPSNAPGICRSAVYFDFACFVSDLPLVPRSTAAKLRLNATGKPTVNTRGVRRHVPGLPTPPLPRRRRRVPRRLARPRAGQRLGRLVPGVEPQPIATAPARQTASASCSSPRRLGLGEQRDEIGELGHRVEVAERRQPRQAERVQLVAEQQREVRVLARRTPRGAVVQAASPPGSSRAAARTRARARRPGVRRRRAAAAPPGDRRCRGARDIGAGQPATSAASGTSAAPGTSAARPRPAPAAVTVLAQRSSNGRSCARASTVAATSLAVAVGQRREPGLELRRRRVYAALEQRRGTSGRRRPCRTRPRRRSRSPESRRRRPSTAPGRLWTWTGRPAACGGADRSPSASAAVVSARRA